MVHKKLPKSLVQRLRKFFDVPEKNRNNRGGFFNSLTNIDHRHYPGLRADYGYSIRSLNVSRNYPKIKDVVVKRLHDHSNSSKKFSNHLNYFKKLVKNINNSERANEFVFLNPIAYKVGGDFVAMAKADHPSLFEIMAAEPNRFDEKPTKRGKKAYDQLKKANKLDLVFSHASYFLIDFRMVEANILFLGFSKQGKPVYVPLFDMF